MATGIDGAQVTYRLKTDSFLTPQHELFFVVEYPDTDSASQALKSGANRRWQAVSGIVAGTVSIDVDVSNAAGPRKMMAVTVPLLKALVPKTAVARRTEGPTQLVGLCGRRRRFSGQPEPGVPA